MFDKVPLNELNSRMNRLRNKMDSMYPEWKTVVIFSKINQYYFTGTMQDGLLYIPRDGDAVLWVRRSYERALDESLFENIKYMESFREAAAAYNKASGTVHLETEIVPLALYQRFAKYFPFTDFKSADAAISAVRSIKSPYEISLIKRAGEIHRDVLECRVPHLLKEGMSEADLTTELFKALIQHGHHGVSRFSMFDTEIGLGNIAFGENSLYPTFFNGPGGNLGMSPAVPIMGNRERLLNNGDLIFIDVGCGFEGYHTDKTTTYVFRGKLPKEAVGQHQKCVEIQYRIAEMLKPGITPGQIYNDIMQSLDDDFLKDFMGYQNRRVKFLGHGIGLNVDEMPVIAAGFDMPIEEGMVFAVEPKKGLKGIGMVGIENTFLVTSEGGVCITGDSKGLIQV